MKNEQKFSIKKLLLTILASIIVTNFIAFTILFTTNLPKFIISYKKIENSEVSRTIHENMKKEYTQIEKETQGIKQNYGEDYPAGEIILYRLFNFAESNEIVHVYIRTLLIGIIMGIIIYAVVIQKIRGMDLIIELVVAFIILLSLVFIINLIISQISEIGEILTNDFDNTQLVIISLIIFIIIYIAEMIHQKLLARRLNKELKKEKNTMKYEKSCGCIIIDEDKVLLVKQNSGHWGFPKGHMENNETEIETAIRETKEETNIDVEIDKKHRYSIEYSPKEDVWKEAVYYIAKKKSNTCIAQKSEVEVVEWLTLEDALAKITFDNTREILKQVIEDLK